MITPLLSLASGSKACKPATLNKPGVHCGCQHLLPSPGFHDTRGDISQVPPLAQAPVWHLTLHHRALCAVLHILCALAAPGGPMPLCSQRQQGRNTTAPAPRREGPEAPCAATQTPSPRRPPQPPVEASPPVANKMAAGPFARSKDGAAALPKCWQSGRLRREPAPEAGIGGGRRRGGAGWGVVGRGAARRGASAAQGERRLCGAPLLLSPLPRAAAAAPRSPSSRHEEAQRVGHGGA